MSRLALIVLLVLVGVPLGHPAHASDHALIVTNNRGLALGRPDLQYADDDGAKWLELFDALYGPTNTTLLTTFDAPSRTLFPALVARAGRPTKAALQAAFSELATTLAGEPGGTRVVTVVFAGHGDVADGEGFLELEDARLTATELEALLRALPADRIHLVIDACNAWFMLHPRKPGARRVARQDLGDGLLERDPRVGALLSTSAEATTWEWSEIQSGLFSHALRSGLRGGADVDRDRRVSYRELAAFLAVAHEAVPETYRPRLFVQAPKSAASEPFVRLDARTARRPSLALPNARHIAVRDERGVRVLDGHFEAGAPLELLLPEGALIVDEATTGDVSAARRSFTLSADSLAIGPAPADAATPEVVARGDAMRVEQLFADPFGKNAFERWANAPPEDTAPYGVSRADSDRLGHVLAAAARLEGSSRKFGGVATIGFSLLAGITGFGVADSDDENSRIFGGTLISAGGLGIVLGSLALAMPADLERLDMAYAKAPRDSELDRATTVARFERLLAERADDYRTTRLWTAGTTIAMGVAMAAVATWISIDEGHVSTGSALMFGAAAMMGGLGAYGFTSKHQVEEVWDLYQDLREMPWQVGTPPPLAPVLAPINGGLLVGVNGGF